MNIFINIRDKIGMDIIGMDIIGMDIIGMDIIGVRRGNFNVHDETIGN